MPSRLKSALVLAGSLVLAAGLMWLALRNADLDEVLAVMRDADWRWLGVILPLFTASVAIRAWRWQLLLRALPAAEGSAPQAEGTDGEASFGTVFAATFIGYFANVVTPRVGEFARAGVVAGRSRHGFAGVFGTVVGERVLDVVGLGVAVVVTAALYGERLGTVADDAWAGIVSALAALSPVVVIGALGLLALGVWAVAQWARRGGIGAKVAALGVAFRDGLVAVARTGRPVALVGSTVALWASYALLADAPLRMLGLSATYGIGVVDAFAVMTVGAVGFLLPAPGGAGPFHYATVEVLTVLFGVAPSPAASYAVLAHAAQVVFYAVGGVLSLLALGTSLRAVRADTAREVPVPPEPDPLAPGRAARGPS